MDPYGFIVPPGQSFRLKERDPAFTSNLVDEQAAQAHLRELHTSLTTYQDMLLAQESYAVLVVVQAMDGAAKDGTISAVFAHLDPQVVAVAAFKEPAGEEVRHDYLWRFNRQLPERGQIGVFNRSYYEEVVTTFVHPEQLDQQHLPDELRRPADEAWRERRYHQINNFERYLVENGIVVLKCFLHLSKDKQRERLLERTTRREKQWKFSPRDIEDRYRWDDFMHAYEETLNHTSTPWAPWYVIPADHRWFTPVAVAELVVDCLARLNLSYPEPGSEQREAIARAGHLLEHEQDVHP